MFIVPLVPLPHIGLCQSLHIQNWICTRSSQKLCVTDLEKQKTAVPVPNRGDANQTRCSRYLLRLICLPFSSFKATVHSLYRVALLFTLCSLCHFSGLNAEVVEYVILTNMTRRFTICWFIILLPSITNTLSRGPPLSMSMSNNYFYISPCSWLHSIVLHKQWLALPTEIILCLSLRYKAQKKKMFLDETLRTRQDHWTRSNHRHGFKTLMPT